MRTLDFLAATLAACALAIVSAPDLPAQEAGTVAWPVVQRFPIERSPIELTGPVQGSEYVGVTGPRSAWLGVESGSAELWVHPFKVAREFKLAFQVPEYRDPSPASSSCWTWRRSERTHRPYLLRIEAACAIDGCP